MKASKSNSSSMSGSSRQFNQSPLNVYSYSSVTSNNNGNSTTTFTMPLGSMLSLDSTGTVLTLTTTAGTQTFRNVQSPIIQFSALMSAVAPLNNNNPAMMMMTVPTSTPLTPMPTQISPSVSQQPINQQPAFMINRQQQQQQLLPYQIPQFPISSSQTQLLPNQNPLVPMMSPMTNQTNQTNQTNPVMMSSGSFRSAERRKH